MGLRMYQKERMEMENGVYIDMDVNGSMIAGRACLVDNENGVKLSVDFPAIRRLQGICIAVLTEHNRLLAVDRLLLNRPSHTQIRQVQMHVNTVAFLLSFLGDV